MTHTALTREQEVTLSSMAHQIVVEWSQIVMGLTRNNGLCLKHDIEQLVKDFTLANDAALRATITQQAQTITRLERERDGLREQMNAIAHTRTFEQSCQAIADLKQQLAALRATVEQQAQELEQSKKMTYGWMEQASKDQQQLAAAQARVRELEAAE